MESQFIELGKIRVHFSVILRPSVTVPKIWLRFQSKCEASSQNIPIVLRLKEIYTGSLCPWQKNSNMQTIAIEVAKCAFKLLDSIFLALSTASISGQREFENTQRVIAAKKVGLEYHSLLVKKRRNLMQRIRRSGRTTERRTQSARVKIQIRTSTSELESPIRYNVRELYVRTLR